MPSKRLTLSMAPILCEDIDMASEESRKSIDAPRANCGTQSSAKNESYLWTEDVLNRGRVFPLTHAIGYRTGKLVADEACLCIARSQGRAARALGCEV